MSTLRLFLFLVFNIEVEREDAGVQLYIMSKDPQVLSDESFVGLRLGGRAGEGDPAGVQDHGVVRQAERKLDVLLDQQDRLAFGLEARDGAPDLGDDQRR